MVLWDTLKDFVGKFRDPRGEAVDLGKDEVRLAAATLLVHAMVVDGEVDEREREALRDALERGFDLDHTKAVNLITQAEEKEKEAVDLDSLTSVLTRRLDHEDRIKVAEMLWEVINADEVIHEFEGKLAWRAAQSLGITPNDWVKLRKKIEERHA